ncbi:sensor histidine kinase [Chitinophaga sp. 30R24]|uniref:sensor histidine kinase n=1 Tax=Chitinophaga sp. 30R24 TaxID=3248838 RepID=UPI003B900F7A
MGKGVSQLLLNYAERSWNNVVCLGVHPAMPFMEARRTRLLNLLSLPCIPFMLFYCLLNAIQGRYLLSALNLLTTLVSLTVLWLHKYRKYLSARVVLIFFSTVIYTFTGIYFHNGAEYFLLNILVITILVYDNVWLVGGLSILITGSFLTILFMPQSWYLAPPVPPLRVWANVGVSLTFLIIALSYFKRIQSDYQSAIEKQRQALLTMNKDKEKLFSIVAHDIRSPLATLETLLDMFQKGHYTRNDMDEAIAILHNKISQLGGTLDNVLRWSTRSMKGIQTRPRHFLLQPLLVEVLQFFEMVIQQKNIAIVLEIPTTIALHADRDQVSVILRNLVSNALKFSYPGGNILINTQLVADQVAIGITDYGKGITERQMEELFTSQQHPGYGTSGERGSGLGLILCREFVELNKGFIQVESSPGAGTVFTVLLSKGNYSDGDLSIAN